MNHDSKGWAVLLACALIPVASAQTPINGSFENGFTNWNLLGTGSSVTLTAAQLGNQITPTDGNLVALISTGSGNLNGPTADRDGNGVNDFDLNAISTTLNFNLFPAVIKYDFAFASSEQDQPDIFDDIFDVLIGTTLIHSGSSNKPGGSSTYPDAPASNKPGLMIDTGQVNPTNLPFGVPDLSPFCTAIPGAVPGDNSLNLQILVADQNDPTFDSALVIDNIRVESNCGTPGTFFFSQMTDTSLGQVTLKDGTLISRFAQSLAPSSSSNGARMAFISSANYDGTNPSLLQQAYLFENSAITRMTSFTGDEVHSLSISEDGDYAVFSARATPEDNLEIYRLEIDTGQLDQMTTTANCENTAPDINNNGQRIVFLSTCGDDIQAGFNPDGNREVVFINRTTLILNETTDCLNFRPVVQATNSGNIAAYASDCNYDGMNADGNIEVFRFDRRGGGSFTQVTNTTGDIAVLDSVDINRNGRYISYIAQDTVANYVIFRYDNNAGTSSFMGQSRADRLPISVQMIDDNNPNHIFYEALDLFNFSNVISHIDISTQIVTDSSAISGTSGMASALIGGAPHTFIAVTSDLIGSNGDGNLEIFQGRVE